MIHEYIIIQLLIVFKRLKINFNFYLFKKILKYLPTHCGVILTLNMVYSTTFNNIICKNTPCYCVPFTYKWFTGKNINHFNEIHRTKNAFLKQKWYIIVCKDHNQKNNIIIPTKMYNINDYYTIKTGYIICRANINLNQIKKINFLINWKKEKEKRKLTKKKNNIFRSNKKYTLLFGTFQIIKIYDNGLVYDSIETNFKYLTDRN